MNIHELLLAVQQKNMPTDILELYHDELTHLFASLQMEMAELEKEEAIFIFQRKTGAEKLSDISIKRAWAVTEKGQREIEVDRSLKALAKELSGLKHKLYNTL